MVMIFTTKGTKNNNNNNNNNNNELCIPYAKLGFGHVLKRSLSAAP